MAKPSTKRQRARDFWQHHVMQWQQSQLRAKTYASEQGLDVEQFNRWRYRLKREAQPVKKAFVPVRMVSPVLKSCPVVLTGAGGLQLTLELSSEQLPVFLPFVRDLLCGH
jgi:hypothetical protein